MQKILQSHLRGVSTTVFGRVNDFKAQVLTDPPDAILTNPVLIEQIEGFTVSVNGIRKNSPEQTHTLLSIDKPMSVESITSETVVGIVDVLGRNAMKSFTSGMFPVVPGFRLVTKVEDLLPLLMFSMANAIIIDTAFADYFRNTSNLTFFSSGPLPVKSGIIALAHNINVSNDCITAQLLNDTTAVTTLFKVDKWLK